MSPETTGRPTFVYFARWGAYIKVGCTSNVDRRIRDLAAPSQRRSLRFPADIPDVRPELLGVIPGTVADEVTYQARLAEWAAVGEWFRATPEALALIAEWCPEPVTQRVWRERGHPRKVTAA